jgi:hypothetical protein
MNIGIQVHRYGLSVPRVKVKDFQTFEESSVPLRVQKKATFIAVLLFDPLIESGSREVPFLSTPVRFISFPRLDRLCVR